MKFTSGSLVTTWSHGPPSRHVYFEDTPTETLRSMLQPIADKVGRAQLLALARNRWPCGYWVELLDEPASA